MAPPQRGRVGGRRKRRLDSSGPMTRSRQRMKRKEGQEDEGGVVQPTKVADVTMDLDLLDCPVCCHPLRPPVFQCTAGHIICASCLYKLPDNRKCHFCSLGTVYNRCHTVEKIIESIRVACSNSTHGCTARITYYQKEDHENGCPHAPCFCPASGCSFSGPTAKLVDHFSDNHKWTTTKYPYKKEFKIRLNVGSTFIMGEDGHLFNIRVTVEPLGGVLTVCCVQPHSTGSKFICRLTLTEPSYSQSKEFLVSSTNLRDGVPEDCALFIVSKPQFWETGASATPKVGMVLACELTPRGELCAGCGDLLCVSTTAV